MEEIDQTSEEILYLVSSNVKPLITKFEGQSLKGVLFYTLMGYTWLGCICNSRLT